MLTTQAVAVPAGPGSVQVHVNAVLPTSEHSTHVYAYGRDTGQPRNIVVDRLMRWGSGTEGHRSPGSSTASSVWEFAEGGHGFFTTYVAVFNPNPVATTVRVYYRHENGSVYSQDVGLPAFGRAVVGTPTSVPTGGFGLKLVSLNGQWITAERMVYAGSGWEVGHAGPGAPSASTTWRFAEGSGAGGFFDTYLLLTNVMDVAATTTLTYRTAAGVVIGTDTLVIPAYGRGTVWANGTAGAQDFSTEVTSTQLILAERAMYWPTESSSLLGGGESVSAASADLLTPAVPVGPSPYTLADGVPGPTVAASEGSEEVVVGRKAPSARGAPGRSSPGSSVGVERQLDALSSSSGPVWYGSHVSVGRKP